MSRIDDTIQAKIEKRHKLEAAGVLVHPYSFDKKHSISQARAAQGQVVTTAGRIRALRTHGQLAFMDLEDPTGRIQLMLRAEAIGAEAFALVTAIDTGDYLGVTGEVGISKTGEITIVVSSYQFLGKSLRPLPTEWNAAEDKEVRFRRRYVDMLVNPDVKRVLDARWVIIKEIRRYLQDVHSFVEVETPILQPLYGGTNAKPFMTHMNALDCTFYLRLAPELYLKRLIVGGYERVFEIARNFRNEGIDQTHQPEFTMIEWYEAYADYHRMMDVAEGMVKHLVNKLYQSSVIKVGEHEVDIGGTWPRITMTEGLKRWENIDFAALSDDEVKALMVENKLELIGEYTRGKALFSIFDHLVPKKLIQPTWIIDYPKDVSPLAKQHRSQPEMVERFECYIGGKELADGWSELTDALDQRARFENEQKRMRAGDSEAHPVDEDFLEAMEYGLPPLGGIGIGIDRLVMFLTNTWSIKEVIAFPTLRPLNAQPGVSKTAATAEPAAVTQPKKLDLVDDSLPLPPRAEAEALVEKYLQNPALKHHSKMVARAMAAYAQKLGEDPETWYQAGLLHDLDWELFPDEHPTKAVTEWLAHYPSTVRRAILAHAPERTGQAAETLLEKYLFACDELSGLLHAVSLMRPTGFEGMEVKSVKKKLKDKSFAANVSRADIDQGASLIGSSLEDHIAFLITVFNTN